MKQTVEAVIDEQGHVRLIEQVNIKGLHRAWVTVLDEAPEQIAETTQLVEKCLAQDWLNEEEYQAWTHLLGISLPKIIPNPNTAKI